MPRSGAAAQSRRRPRRAAPTRAVTGTQSMSGSDRGAVEIAAQLCTLDAPVYIERVALTDAKHHMRARKAVRRAIQMQAEGRGFAFVEVLSACPTGWSIAPPEAIHWVEQQMVPVFPLRTFKDRSQDQ